MATNRNKVGTSEPGLMSSAPFVGGLNTELNGIVDSTDFTKDELNMMIRADGSRSRRPGVDYEEGFVFNNELIDTSIEDFAFNCIEWIDVNGPDETQTWEQIPYIVVQIGSQVIFYKNKGQPYSKEEIDYTLDLTTYKLSGRTNKDVAKARCKFTVAYGCLFITSSAIKPIRLRCAQDETAPYIPTSAPYCTVSCAAYYAKHGSHHRMGSYSGKIAYCEFMLDGLVVGRYNVALNGAGYVPFPNSATLAAYFNSIDATTRRNFTATANPNPPNPSTATGRYGTWTPADFITFTAGSPNDRGTEVRLKLVGYKAKGTCKNEYHAVVAGGTGIYSYTSGLELLIRDTTRGAEDYLPIDEAPEKMSYAHLYNLMNQGWTIQQIADFYSNSGLTPKVFPANNLAQQYLKDTKTEAFKPQKIINMTFGNTPAARGHYRLDFFDQKRNTTAGLTAAMATLAGRLNKTVAEIIDTTIPSDNTGDNPGTHPAKQVPDVKPRRDYVADICAYAGRIFYLCGDVLLYSQIISEDIENANKCYTDADPTSEEMSDVVETDGGLISLPDIGDGVRLAQFGPYLFVFGTRGNVVITGTANNIFTATAYSAGSLNSVPTQAPDSFVNTEFGVFYWGTTGINVLGSGESGLAVQDISTDRILTWFGKLSNTQHKYCKGVYSSSKKKIYWFYPSDDNQPRRLDCCLVYDIKRGSFAPQKIASDIITNDEETEDVAGLPEVVSGLSLKVPFKANREYPVFVSTQNYIDLPDGFIRFYRELNVLEDGFLFRIKADALKQYIPVGETKAIFRFAGIDMYSVRRDADDSFTLIYYYPGGTATKGFYDTEVLWGGIVGREGNTTIRIGAVNEGATGFNYNDLIAYEVPSAYISFNNSIQIDYDLHSTPTEGYVEVYKEALGDIKGSFCLFDPDTFGKHDEADSGEALLEVLKEENGEKILADEPIDSEAFTYESSILLCLDVANMKVTFGDFRNNLLKDWTVGDWEGDGYVFDSYLISHPMNATQTSSFTGRRITDLVHTKNMPYLVTYFRRTETGETTEGNYIYPSQCQGSILWDWRTTGRMGKWSSPSELYRPYKNTIFDNGYIINKTNIRGLGRAYQVKLESVGGSQFILEGLVYDLKNDGRI